MMCQRMAWLPTSVIGVGLVGLFGDAGSKTTGKIHGFNANSLCFHFTSNGGTGSLVSEVSCMTLVGNSSHHRLLRRNAAPTRARISP